MRLDKFLSNAGIASRSQIKKDCKKGIVTVNGIVVKESEHSINEDSDVICYNGKQVLLQKNRYIMLNKPAGVVSATQDRNDKTVLDLIAPDIRKDMFPVGRLDKDTTGLLLLTNDGDLSHNLLSPRKHVDKVYFVICANELTDYQKHQLENGVDIGEPDLTLPAKVEYGIDLLHIYLTITEGKFHQVKRMLKSVGNEVLSLKRVRMGSLCLDESLLPGEYRELTEKEIEGLKRCE